MTTKTWGAHRFLHSSAVEPKTDANGTLIEETAHELYHAAATTRLNPHGRGPFCRFALPGLPDVPGVYVITVGERPVYVGSTTKSLRERLAVRGPGRISPANCFVRGRSTFCKINHRILCAARDRLAIDLWIHQTASPESLRDSLVALLRPSWNARA